MVTTYINYQTIARDMNRSIELVGQEPVTARETEYYLENISSAKTIDDFMADSRLYNYALKAHGLEEIAYAKALIRKVLTEGIDDPNSFANQLNDKRYRELVEAFNFVRHGTVTTIFTDAQQGTVDKYLRQTLEQNAGVDNEGVRLALYFQRNAPTITSAYEILADPALSIVARTILSLPPEFAGTNIDKQAEFFEEKIDFSEFSDPEKLNNLLQRFTSLWELENPSTTVTSASLFSSSSTGISSELILAINNLKLGG